MLAAIRRGSYFRVFKPEWDNPLDTAFSRRFGGRWNGRETFGVVSLKATLAVAAANARNAHRDRAIGLFDLRPERRPSLLQVNVTDHAVLDVVTTDGLRRLRLPQDFPWHVSHERCQPIGLRAYRAPGFYGIASRSAAECTQTHWVGEELAWFDRSPALRETGRRRAFVEWYPDLIP